MSGGQPISFFFMSNADLTFWKAWITISAIKLQFILPNI